MSSELEQVLEHFLPPGLLIEEVTRKSVELSARNAALADKAFGIIGKAPFHENKVYNFLSQIAYTKELHTVSE